MFALLRWERKACEGVLAFMSDFAFNSAAFTTCQSEIGVSVLLRLTPEAFKNF